MSASDKQNNEGSVPGSYNSGPVADEVSISELVRDVGRQWKVVVGVTMLCLAAGILYIYLSTDVYRYNVEIEIGHAPGRGLPESVNFVVMPGSNRGWPSPPGFEAPNIVMNRLTTALIPETIRSVSEEKGRDMEVSVSNPDDHHGWDTRIVRLSAVASKKHENEVNRILQLAAARVVAQHTDFLRGILERKESEISRLEHRQGGLDRRLDAQNERINRLQKLVDRTGESSLGAAIELNVLMPERKNLVVERAQTNEQINRLKEEMEALELAIREMDTLEVNEEVLQKQQHAAAVLKASLSIQPTRTLSVASSGNRPVGTDPELILALALVLGIGIGLILALIVQAVIRERKLKEE